MSRCRLGFFEYVFESDVRFVAMCGVLMLFFWYCFCNKKHQLREIFSKFIENQKL